MEKQFDTWNHNDIINWLNTTQFSEFINCFKWVKTSEHLFRLSMEDLCVMGVEAAAAPVLYQEIQKLKERHKVKTPTPKSHRGYSVGRNSQPLPIPPKQHLVGGSWPEGSQKKHSHDPNLSSKFASLSVASAPSSQNSSRNPSPRRSSSKSHMSLGHDVVHCEHPRPRSASRSQEFFGPSFQNPNFQLATPFVKEALMGESMGNRQWVSNSSPSFDHSTPLYSPRKSSIHHSDDSIPPLRPKKVTGKPSITPPFMRSPSSTLPAPFLRTISAPPFSLPQEFKYSMSDIVGVNDETHSPLSDFPLFLLNSLYNYEFSETGLLILEVPKYGHIRYLLGVDRKKFLSYFSSKEVVAITFTHEDVAKVFDRFWFKVDMVLPANSTVNDLYYCHLSDGSGRSFFRPDEIWVSQIIDKATSEKRHHLLKSYTNDEDAIELAKYALDNNQINVDKFLVQAESRHMSKKDIQNLRILLQGISTTLKVFPKYSIQPNFITAVSLLKWREFLLRFGPISSLHANLSSFLTSEVVKYYHGPLDRIQAENLLTEHFQNSHQYMCMFLLRDATNVQQSQDLQASYTFCVSCCLGMGRVEHWRIFQEGGQFFCSGKYFESLSGCVDYLRNLEWPLGAVPVLSEYYSNLKL